LKKFTKLLFLTHMKTCHLMECKGSH